MSTLSSTWYYMVLHGMIGVRALVLVRLQIWASAILSVDFIAPVYRNSSSGTFATGYVVHNSTIHTQCNRFLMCCYSNP